VFSEVRENSPRLAMPLMQQGQAQKHVTHNEALEILDIIVQLTVESFEAVDPPAKAMEGQIWAIGMQPVAAWAGESGNLAAWSNGGWLFVTPKPGWRAAKGDEIRIWTGDAWVTPRLSNLNGLGVNANSDTENRLAVASPAVLFTHAGAGHQLKINKAAAGDTASLLFQTGFSGRAEMGLAGEDDFSFKVSPDGAAWHAALTVGRTNGVVELPNGATLEGHPALHRGNLIGTVDQAGGVPTGAVIERGSNANGQYVRFADGTQICRSRGFFNSTLNAGETTGGTWTFPVAFAPGSDSEAGCAINVRSSNTVAGCEDAARSLNVSAGVGQLSAPWAIANRSNSSMINVRADLVAFGRWF
jgi:hypothetical protein